MNRTFPQRWVSWLWLVPVLLAISFNLNVLQNGFGWDDENIIPNLTPPERWLTLFLPDPTAVSSPKEASSYFRPLISVSYILDHRIWGDNPFGFHLSVLLAHLINTALVFFLAKALVTVGQARGPAPTDLGRTTVRPYLPLIAASLFAVHPAHAEAVAWIAGRNDIFCTAFMLSSLLLYIRFHRTGSGITYLFSMLAFFLALLTKETAVGLLPLFPLADHLVISPDSARRWRRIAVRLLIPLAIAGLYFWMRAAYISSPYGLSSGDQSSSALFSWSAISKMIGAAGLYLKLILFPYPHNPFITTLPTSVLSIGSAGLILVLLFGGGVYALRHHRAVPGIGLAWTVLFILPAGTIAVFGIATTPAAERYAYAPSAGFLIVAAWLGIEGIEKLRAATGLPQQKVWIASGLLFVALSGMGGWESWKRNRVWQSSSTFWQAAVSASPEAAYPHGQLGIQYIRSGRYAEAEREFETAMKRIENPAEQVNLLSNLGNLYTMEGRYPEAEAALKTALNQDPANDEIQWHLAELYFAISVRKEEATPDGRRVTDYDPALFNEAEKYLTQALALRPMIQLFFEAGTIYTTFGKRDEAESYFRKVLSADPHSKTRLAIMARQRLAHLMNERTP